MTLIRVPGSGLFLRTPRASGGKGEVEGPLARQNSKDFDSFTCGSQHNNACSEVSHTGRCGRERWVSKAVMRSPSQVHSTVKLDKSVTTLRMLVLARSCPSGAAEHVWVVVGVRKRMCGRHQPCASGGHQAHVQRVESGVGSAAIAAMQRAPCMGLRSGQAERGEKRDLTFRVSQHRWPLWLMVGDLGL